MGKKVTKKKTTARSTAGKGIASAKANKRPKEVVNRENKAGETISESPQTYLNKKELEHFRQLLLDKLKEITGDVAHFEQQSLRSSRQDAAGDLSMMPIHMADIGSDNYEQEFALGLMDTERKVVNEIIEALKRIDNGSYGMCEGTGQPIPKPRLEAFPWARYCVQYAEKLENGR